MYQVFALFAIFAVSFAVTFFIFQLVIPRLKQAKIVGKDMHKPGKPEVPEMGGLVMVAGFSAGVIITVAIETFSPNLLSADLIQILAVFSVILVINLIGIFDDLIEIRQAIKAITPLLASLPLAALKIGNTTMSIPFLGNVDFGIVFPLILVPIGITGAANACNMLAGFNGLEIGMGIIATGALAIIAYSTGATTSFVLLLAILGALIATLRYNWHPSKVFIGDTGTLSVGAIIASVVILGNFEMAGIIIIIPYALDFLLKAFHRFPKTWGMYKNGKLYCPAPRPIGLAQLLMKLCGGIKERNLVLTLIGIEAIFGAIAVMTYVYF